MTKTPAMTLDNFLKNAHKRAPIQLAWLDAFGVDAEWRDMDSAEGIELCCCETRGYLMYHGDDRLCVALSICEATEQACGMIAIPKAGVTEIKLNGRTWRCPKVRETK